jgi:hypothetical protein
MTVTSFSDIDQIRDLKARFCRYVDAKQWEAVAGLFTDDAVMRIHNPDGSLASEASTAELAADISGRLGAGQPIHHLFSHEIAFTSDTTATGVWAMESLVLHDRQAHPGAPFTRMHGFGHYHDTYRKVDGAWRIAACTVTRIHVDVDD